MSEQGDYGHGKHIGEEWVGPKQESGCCCWGWVRDGWAHCSSWHTAKLLLLLPPAYLGQLAVRCH